MLLRNLSWPRMTAALFAFALVCHAKGQAPLASEPPVREIAASAASSAAVPLAASASDAAATAEPVAIPGTPEPAPVPALGSESNPVHVLQPEDANNKDVAHYTYWLALVAAAQAGLAFLALVIAGLQIWLLVRQSRDTRESAQAAKSSASSSKDAVDAAVQSVAAARDSADAARASAKAAQDALTKLERPVVAVNVLDCSTLPPGRQEVVMYNFGRSAARLLSLDVLGVDLPIGTLPARAAVQSKPFQFPNGTVVFAPTSQQHVDDLFVSKGLPIGQDRWVVGRLIYQDMLDAKQDLWFAFRFDGGSWQRSSALD